MALSKTLSSFLLGSKIDCRLDMANPWRIQSIDWRLRKMIRWDITVVVVDNEIEF